LKKLCKYNESLLPYERRFVNKRLNRKIVDQNTDEHGFDGCSQIFIAFITLIFLLLKEQIISHPKNL
jgi:hypothetical protein